MIGSLGYFQLSRRCFLLLSLWAAFLFAQVRHSCIHGFLHQPFKIISSVQRRRIKPGYVYFSSVASNSNDNNCNENKSSSGDHPSTVVGSIDNIERIYAISDLHTDNVSNLDLLRNICMKQKRHNKNNSENTHDNIGIGENDAIIIAGDISHEISKLKETLCLVKQNLNCHIFFIWGNHEAWIGGREMDEQGITSSLQKINVVKSICQEIGIHTECKLVGSHHENPAFVLPIESWYDATLSLQDCEDLCTSFGSWRWVDFIRCVWPDQVTIQQILSQIHNGNDNHEKKEEEEDFGNDGFNCSLEVQNTGQIPLGLTTLFYHQNKQTIKEVQKLYSKLIDESNLFQTKQNKMSPISSFRSIPGLITYSHFLPNQKTLPDWKEPQSDSFLRKEWLDHPVPDISAKFAKVAGSILIDEQIRKIIPPDKHPFIKQSVQHLHVFGHSHRPKDFVYNDIRYIHNPLGKPAEREMNMVAHDVGFQLIWDCTKQSPDHENNKNICEVVNCDKNNNTTENNDKIISSVGSENGSFGGEIPGTQVIRYWEEQGGGKKVLARKMKHRKKRRRLEVKRFVRTLELSKNPRGGPTTSSSD